MVGVGPPPHDISALARVSIVNYHGVQVYDSYVLPKEPVTDFRTYVSGITPHSLKRARTFEQVQRDVAELFNGAILVGHAIQNDLDALLLGHPRRDIRDTSKYPKFRAFSAGKTPGLKKLAKEVLGVEIQGGMHSSIEDARATMLLYRREKDGFEKEHARKYPVRNTAVGANGAGNSQGSSKKNKKKSGKK